MLRMFVVAVLVSSFVGTAVREAIADNVLKTEHGATQMLIVRQDTAVFKEPDDSTCSQKIQKFTILVALPADEFGAKTKNHFYKVAVATSPAKTIGWVVACDVVQWPHRQILRFTKRDGRAPAIFFSNAQAAHAYLSEGSCSQAIGQEPDESYQLSLLPILATSECSIKGETVTTFQVAHLRDVRPVPEVAIPGVSLLSPLLRQKRNENQISDSLAAGYVPEVDSDGNRTVEAHLLVSRKDLRAFRSAVEFCVRVLDGTDEPRSHAKVINSLRTLTAQLCYGQELAADMQSKDVLQLISGLPVHASCFALTREHTTNVSQKDFNAWVNSLDASLSRIDEVLDNSRWFHLNDETESANRFGFIAISDLP